MATTKYRCTNYGGCDKALQHEIIEIEDGDEAICPEKDCGLKLEPLNKVSAPPPKWIYAAVGAVLLAAGGTALLLRSPKPNADMMLTDFYPQLPKR